MACAAGRCTALGVPASAMHENHDVQICNFTLRAYTQMISEHELACNERVHEQAPVMTMHGPVRLLRLHKVLQAKMLDSSTLNDRTCYTVLCHP